MPSRAVLRLWIAQGSRTAATVDRETMAEQQETAPVLDLRHVARVRDKEMPIDQPGMEMSKPGAPDLRRRKHTVTLPSQAATPGPDDPPQTVR
jgi:hypothetical protein